MASQFTCSREGWLAPALFVPLFLNLIKLERGQATLPDCKLVSLSGFGIEFGSTSSRMQLQQHENAEPQAAEVIARGGVIAFLTDTFYGLGVNPFDADAVRRVQTLKGREEGKPILIVISDPDQVARFIEQPSPEFVRLSERFWPGPLTLIGTARAEVPGPITGGTGTIGVRLPNDEDVRSLVRACGGALTATSANPASMPPASSAQQVANYFPEGLDLIVDGGPARTDRPSTVVDVSGSEVRVLREGMISRAALMGIPE
jgi:L-threonylcarbamoyladenylate synthase